MLDDFERYPLTFGPSPVHRLDRLTQHLGGAAVWAKRDDCNSGPRLRRQQDAQARVPRRRRARQGLRHARLDRRRAVEPHAPGRRRLGPPRASLRARAGELGRLAGRRLRPRRQHHAQPHHGRRRAARAGRLRHRLQGELGGRRSATSRQAGGTPYAIPAGASDHPLGGLGFASWAREVAAAGARARRLLRHGHRVRRHRLDARRHDRRLRAAGAGRAA